ncbi:MAG: 60S ribosomal protein L22 [Promethearchaeota archaeon]
MGKKTRRKLPDKEPEIPPITINIEQLAFDYDKDIDNMARFIEERITPRDGLKEVVRTKNNLELKITKPLSKRKIKLFVKKYLHKSGLKLDFKVLASMKDSRRQADFHIYPKAS